MSVMSECRFVIRTEVLKLIFIQTKVTLTFWLHLVCRVTIETNLGTLFCSRVWVKVGNNLKILKPQHV